MFRPYDDVGHIDQMKSHVIIVPSQDAWIHRAHTPTQSPPPPSAGGAAEAGAANLSSSGAGSGVAYFNQANAVQNRSTLGPNIVLTNEQGTRTSINMSSKQINDGTAARKYVDEVDVADGDDDGGDDVVEVDVDTKE